MDRYTPGVWAVPQAGRLPPEHVSAGEALAARAAALCRDLDYGALERAFYGLATGLLPAVMRALAPAFALEHTAQLSAAADALVGVPDPVTQRAQRVDYDRALWEHQSVHGYDEATPFGRQRPVGIEEAVGGLARLVMQSGVLDGPVEECQARRELASCALGALGLPWSHEDRRQVEERAHRARVYEEALALEALVFARDRAKRYLFEATRDAVGDPHVLVGWLVLAAESGRRAGLEMPDVVGAAIAAWHAALDGVPRDTEADAVVSA